MTDSTLPIAMQVNTTPTSMPGAATRTVATSNEDDAIMDKMESAQSRNENALPADGKYLNEINVDEIAADAEDFSKSSIAMSFTSLNDDTPTNKRNSLSCSSSRNLLQLQEHSKESERMSRKTLFVAVAFVLVGALVSSIFLWVGITNEQEKQNEVFQRQSSDILHEVESAWHDYESSALWIHSACRNWRDRNFTAFNYQDFEMLYKYIASGGLEFREMQWVPNITHTERPYVEALGSLGWNTVLPEGAEFEGFIGQEPDLETGELRMSTRSVQPFYFPIHFGEPRTAAVYVAGYDLYSPPWEKPAIERALETYKPALTGGFTLASDLPTDGLSVVLYHPGTPDIGLPPKDLSTMVINIPDLLLRAARFSSASLGVFLYDYNPEETNFLGGLEINILENEDDDTGSATRSTKMSAIPIEDVIGADDLALIKTMSVGGRTWKIVVVPVDDSFSANYAFVILSAALIFISSILVAAWMVHSTRRAMEMNLIMREAAAEAAIVSDMFPDNVRKRLIEDLQRKKRNDPTAAMGDFFVSSEIHNGSDMLSSRRLEDFLTSEGVFGSKAIADFFPYTTIMFCDLVGFSAWSSTRQPSAVFSLLEVLYHSFDIIAKRRRVFKVETVGDWYVPCIVEL